MIKRIKVSNRKDLEGKTLEQEFSKYTVILPDDDNIFAVGASVSRVYNILLDLVNLGLGHTRNSRGLIDPFNPDEPIEYEVEFSFSSGDTVVFQLSYFEEQIISEALVYNSKPVILISRESPVDVQVFDPIIQASDLEIIKRVSSTYLGSIILEWTDLGGKIKEQLAKTLIITDRNLAMIEDNTDPRGNLIKQTIDWYDQMFPGMRTKKLLESLIPELGFEYNTITDRYELAKDDDKFSFPLHLCGAGMERVILLLPALYAAGVYDANVICPAFSQSLHPLLGKRLLRFFKLRDLGQLIITQKNFDDND